MVFRLPRRRYRAVIYRMLADPPNTSRREYALPWRWLWATANTDRAHRLALYAQIAGYGRWHGYVENR